MEEGRRCRHLANERGGSSWCCYRRWCSPSWAGSSSVLGWVVLWRQGFYLLDDAYITFRYVANLAAGHGLVWNPGEHVEGYTNLLWVLMLAPFALLELDLTIPAAVLGTLFGCGTLEVLRRIVRTALPGRPLPIQLLPGLLLATSPSFAFWSTSGMETPLFCFWVLLSIHLLLLARVDRRYLGPAGLTLAACCLTRPEGLLVAGLALLVELLAARPDGQRLAGRLRRVLLPGLVVAAVAAAHLGFRLWYYGDPLPNTFYAKVLPGVVALQRGGAHLLAFALVGGLFAVPGLVALRRRGPARPYLVHGYLLLAVYLLYLLVIDGDYPGWYRFYLPLLPLPLVGLAWAVARFGDLLAAGAPGRRPGILRLLVPAVCLVGLCLPVPLCWSRSEASAARGLKLSGELSSRLNEVFFRRQVPPQSYVAVSAVGMIGYYTPYRILDTWGLNDRHIGHAPANPVLHNKFAHDKGDWVYVLERRPDYIVTFRRWRLGRLKGYDICWPSHLPIGLVVYRRKTLLTEQQRGLGMPPGQRRTMLRPPGCIFPPWGPVWPPRQRAIFARTAPPVAASPRSWRSSRSPGWGSPTWNRPRPR
jgi:hypothetical protein